MNLARAHAAPETREAPKVADDVLAAAFGADRLGMVLHGPERLDDVLHRHEHLPVLLAVVRPRERPQRLVAVEDDVQRVVPDRLDRSDVLEYPFLGVLDAGDLAVLDDVEAFQRRAELDREALQPKTHAEHRQEVFVSQLPYVADDADVGIVGGRTWPGSDDDGGEVLEEPGEFSKGERIVLENVHGAAWDRFPTEGGEAVDGDENDRQREALYFD